MKMQLNLSNDNSNNAVAFSSTVPSASGRLGTGQIQHLHECQSSRSHYKGWWQERKVGRNDKGERYLIIFIE